MDYSKVLGRAWEITWRWKVLWILGFLTALGQAGNNRGSGNFRYSTGRGQGPLGLDIPPEVVGILIPLICLAILLGIALWVVSVIARGGLIGGVQQVEKEGATSFGQAWKAGVSRFWTLVGIGLLTGLPLFLATLIMIAIGVALVFGAGITAYRFDTPAPLGVLAPILICAVPGVCLLVIAGVVLNWIRIYAERAAILEGLSWIDALIRGWEVFKENLGPTVIMGLIFLVIGLVIGLIVLVIVSALSLPLIALIAGITLFQKALPLLIIPTIFGGLVAMLTGAVIGSVVETFRSTTWTLAYRELTGPAVTLAEVDELDNSNGEIDTDYRKLTDRDSPK